MSFYKKYDIIYIENKKGNDFMDKKLLIRKLLEKYTCLTSRQISVFAYTQFNETISAASAGGILRAMADKGEVCCSPNEHNANVYWLVEE